MTTRTIVLGCLLAISFSSAAPGQTYTTSCDAPKGVYLSAPNWKSEADGLSATKITLSFNGDLKAAGVKSFVGDKIVNEQTGIGGQMNGGFSITILAGEYVETYVFSAGTRELLFSKVRMSSALLPNAIMAMRSTCQ